MKKQAQSQKGQVLVVVVFVFVGLLLMVGLAFDGGTLFLRRRRMQNAADAASLAGTRILYYKQRQESMDAADEAELLAEIHTLAERNDVPDTDGMAGNAVNDSVVAYYVTVAGTRILSGTEAIPIGQSGSLALAEDAEGVEANTETQFEPVLLGLIGISSVSAEARATAVYESVVGGGGWAIFANSDDCSDYGKLAIDWPGSDTHVTGDVHTNDNIHIGGSNNTVTGDTEYVTDCTDGGGGNDIDCVPAGILPMPINYKLADYEPGGRAALIAAAAGKYYPIVGDLKTGENFQGDGLYYVTAGNAALLNVSDLAGSITVVVADGLIDLSGSSHNLTPYIDGLLFFTNQGYTEGDKACSDPVIKMAGSSHNWAGVLYAPDGLCEVSGSDNTTFSGGIICHAVKLSGANLNIQYGPEYMPQFLNRVYLVR